jgi:L-rhamnose mutarotase
MKIIAFGNARYKRIAHNWAIYLRNHGINNYTIYSLDCEIYEYLIENKINTELLDLNIFEDKTWKWRERVKFVSALLNKGTSVLHSDLDAIWLKNPLSFIKEDNDIVASTGTYPKDIYKKIGFTVCMGWIYYKSSPIVKILLENTLNQGVNHNFDDQVEFNREIFNNPKYSSLNLKTLDQSIISIGQTHNENTYVAHPLSPKHIDREKFLKSKNLWTLQ